MYRDTKGATNISSRLLIESDSQVRQIVAGGEVRFGALAYIGTRGEMTGFFVSPRDKNGLDF